MKTLFILFLVNLPLTLLAQNNTLEHTWYVENTVTNNLQKATITLTLDSISKTGKETICTTFYNFHKDGEYYYSQSCRPTEVIPEITRCVAGVYYGGTWSLLSKNQLVLTVGKTKREFTLQWISNRKVVLTEI